MTNPLADMDKPDVIFCIGTNMTETHPVAATGLKKALARGAKMIVADPREIELARLSDVYLPIRVGSDTALLLAMAHVIAREGLVDEGFMAARTTEGQKFLEHVERFHDLGIPLLIGHSRKSFLEAVTDKPSAERDTETLAVSQGLITKGVEILRVHDVKGHATLLSRHRSERPTRPVARAVPRS